MTDTIERQAAIDEIKDMYVAAEKWAYEAKDEETKARAESCMATNIEMKLRIEKLPSAQPEPIRLRIDHELSKEEYERLKKDCAEQPIILLPKESAQQWIPCSERLPEVGKDVMVCYDFKGHRSVLIGVLYGDEKFHGYDDEYLTPEGRKYRKAVAWMPLPEAWKGEHDE